MMNNSSTNKSFKRRPVSPVKINLELATVHASQQQLNGENVDPAKLNMQVPPSPRQEKQQELTREDSETSSVGERTTVSGATEQVVKKFRQKFIILHYSPFKAVWDWIVLLLVVYTAIFTPFTVAFLLNEDEKRAILNQHASTRLFKGQQSGADPFVIIDLIVDLMFMIDIFISFRTTFVSKEGEAVSDPMAIAKNYLKGWFLIDAVSAMPYDLILFGSGNIDNLKVTGLLKTTRLIRLIRIFPKLQKFSEYGGAMLLLLMAAFGLVGHWLACVFYAIAYIERQSLDEPKYSWLDHLAEKYNMPYRENNSESGPDLKSKYITALFFTLTSLTSVGFGNVSPTTNYEKIFSIMSMLLGSLISAAIFGNVTTIMIKMYQGTEELKEMQESVKDFIKFHSIPKTLSKRMQESFEHTWSFTNGIDMNTVLKSFPESLQADICLHLNRQLLNRCPAFQDASEGCLRMLALQFKSTHTPPGDTLIHRGDNLTAIYFIARGTLQISRNDEVMAILDKNDIFGENISKYQEKDLMGRSSCDVKAISYCDLHKIERCDLLDVLEMYPDFAESFEKKFQVTFDLRECEMSEVKPAGKKRQSKVKDLISISSQKRLSRANNKGISSNVNITCSDENGNLDTSQTSAQMKMDFNASLSSNPEQKTVFQMNHRFSSLQFTKKNSIGEGMGLIAISPPDSTSNLNNDSQSNLISIDATRSFSNATAGVLRRKSRMLRNVARLTPLLSAGKRHSSVSTERSNSICRRQISNVSDVEFEIDSLLARVSKAEDTVRCQIDALTSFIYNYVVNDMPSVAANNSS